MKHKAHILIRRKNTQLINIQRLVTHHLLPYYAATHFFDKDDVSKHIPQRFLLNNYYFLMIYLSVCRIIRNISCFVYHIFFSISFLSLFLIISTRIINGVCPQYPHILRIWKIHICT